MNPFSIRARALLALLCLSFAGLGSAAADTHFDASAAAPDAANLPASSAKLPGTVQLAVDPNNSQASYHAREQLAGNNLPSDAVGTTHGVSGMIVLNPDGSVNSDQSQVLLDLTSLMSDEDQRDNFTKSNTLQV